MTDRGNYVGTASGAKFYIMDPQVADVRKADVFDSLSRICRYNGHVNPNDPDLIYSVAQHCVHVAEWLLWRYGDPALALAGLHHDDHEYVGHDLMRPIKHLAGKLVERVPVVQAVIEEALHIPDVGTLGRSRIAEADEVLLVTEIRDLRAPGLAVHSELDALPDPIPMRLTVWTVSHARYAMMDLDARLRVMHNKGVK